MTTNRQNTPTRACFACSLGVRRSRTRKTHPRGHVFRVRCEGQVERDGRAAEHEEHVPEDVFFMFGVRELKGGGGGGRMGAALASRRWGGT